MAEESGKVNAYVCEVCGYRTITKNRDAGTTPFMISCRSPKKCDGFAQSKMYRVDQTLTPAYLWIRPNTDELMRYLAGHNVNMKNNIREHVWMGGLIDVIVS